MQSHSLIVYCSVKLMSLENLENAGDQWKLFGMNRPTGQCLQCVGDQITTLVLQYSVVYHLTLAPVLPEFCGDEQSSICLTNEASAMRTAICQKHPLMLK